MTYSKLRLRKFKNFVSRLVFGDHQNTQISLNFQTSCLQLKNQRSGSKTVCGFSIILILKGIMTFQGGLNKNEILLNIGNILSILMFNEICLFA